MQASSAALLDPAPARTCAAAADSRTPASSRHSRQYSKRAASSSSGPPGAGSLAWWRVEGEAWESGEASDGQHSTTASGTQAATQHARLLGAAPPGMASSHRRLRLAACAGGRGGGSS